MKKQILISALGMVLLGSAAQAQVVIRVGPPAPIVEAVPPIPHEHPDWVWQPGYHRWDGGRYVWVPGTYVQPPRHGARWVAGHWDHRGGGYVWIEGHWR
jgi:hypothetical protein